MKQYKYQMHIHTSPCSACGRMSPSELCQALYENGADPDALGRCVARLLRRRRMPLRKVVASADQRLAVWLKRLFPPKMLQTVLRAYYLGHKN